MSLLREETGNAAAGTTGTGRASSTSDAELVFAARQGDKRAFVEIVARHQAMVCGVALGILGDFAASEDAGQEAFVTAWRKLPELREPERVRPWLAQIARNAALGQLRRRRGHDPLESVREVPDNSLSPDEAIASDEEAALVRESLAKLPESYRLPLILFYRENQSVRAVAESLGLTEDAVKQRLARGREMMRDRMAGLIDNVLKRTGPTPVFTMTVAVAIGALAAPAVMAGGTFAVAATAGGASTTMSPAPFLAAMGTSKVLFVTAAVVTAVFIPVGYQWRASETPGNGAPRAALVEPGKETTPAPPSFEGSAFFAKWKELHDTYGTTAEAMPMIYQAIAEFKDPLERRAFRAALTAEWVQIDPEGGMEFFSRRGVNAAQRRQFFDEWFQLDKRAAVDALLANRGGEALAREVLPEIARRMPDRVLDIVQVLPQSNNYWDTKVRDAVAIVAEKHLAATRAAAEAMAGPNREQALAGVAMAWAKSDLDATIAWATKLSEGTDRDEVIRAALIGKASVDPVAALEHAGLVPPGGRSGYFATTTGARILKEASTVDFGATMAWIAAHPGRFSQADMMGLSDNVANRLNADAAGFLSEHVSSGALNAIIEAVENALMNNASGRRAQVWEWLRSQPESDATKALRSCLLYRAGRDDSDLALRLAAELPTTHEGEVQARELASGILTGAAALKQLDSLLEKAPERMRPVLLQTAFNALNSDTLDHPQKWIERTRQMPETERANGLYSIAAAWASRSPEEAAGWMSTLPEDDTRGGVAGVIAANWGKRDLRGAAAWVAALPMGGDRDRGAMSLVDVMAADHSREAWAWITSIGNESLRYSTALRVAGELGGRDPVAAGQWIESSGFTSVEKAALTDAVRGANRTRTAR